MKKIPRLCNKNYNKLFEEFKFLASQFTPEWKFDENGTDFGVTLAKIFCEMQEDTVNRLNRSVYNIYLTFLKMLGVSLNPRVPARGMISIEASKNQVNSFIKKGAKIKSSNGLTFETIENIDVMYNSIESIYMNSFSNKEIVQVFDAKMGENSRISKFKIFDFAAFQNLQSVAMYICDEKMFNSDGLDLNFRFKNSFSEKKEEEICDFLYKSRWQIFNEKSNLWEDYYEINKSDDFLINVKFKNRAGICEIFGEKSRYLRVIPYEQKEIKLTEISYFSNLKTVYPKEFLSGEEELDEKEFFPFRERFYIYDSFYIKCNKVFNKSGASINLSANVNFIKIKIEPKGFDRNYKMIMSDMDFAESEPSDISIESVTWEYWKGNAWASLRVENGKEFFSPLGNSGERSIKFICPDDICSTNVGAKFGIFIRAKISKIKNQFSIYANYIVPHLKNITLKYSYEIPKRCKHFILNSDLNWKKLYIDDDKNLLNVFENKTDELPSIYIKISRPILSGIFSMFFDIDEGISKNNNAFKWQYWSREIDNVYSWKSFEVIDFTNNFSKSGIVKIFGSKSFEVKELFGEKGYFVRIVDISGGKDHKNGSVINDIKFNTVRIIQKESKPYEYFYMNGKEKNKICSLSSKNAFEIDVWVNEFSEISQEEQNRMEKKFPDCIEIVKNKLNIVEKVWVKWEQISNIQDANQKDRVYEINHESSEIMFGDGRNGKIPTEQYGESIRISYSITDGEKGNLAENSMGEFESVYPSVVGIYNSKPTYGGLDIESVDHAAKRMFDKISRGGRIVSLEGFERAILFNHRNIFKVKCFPHMNKYGKKSFGSLTIVILPRKIEKDYNKFWTIREEVRNFVRENASLNLSMSKNLDICETQYVEFHIDVSINIKRIDDYQDTHNEVTSKIRKFLDPISGGQFGNGFEIGDLPEERDILNIISPIPGVNRIDMVHISNKIQTESGVKEILTSDAKKLKFAVPISKYINVEIKV